MNHSPVWEVKRCLLTNREIKQIAWRPRFSHHVHNSPLVFFYLKPQCQFHDVTFYFFIILVSAPVSSKWSLSFRFSHQNTESSTVLPHASLTPCWFHSRWMDYPNNICLLCTSRSPSLCNFLHYYECSKRLNPNIFLSTLFSNTFGVFTSLILKTRPIQDFKQILVFLLSGKGHL
jgi:hypothetical protein